MGHRTAAVLGSDLGQQRRLVEPPCPLAAPMQRHRHDDVGSREKRATGIRHPASHGGSKIEPIAIFQGVDQRASDIVIAHHGARPVIGGWIADRLHREQARAAVEREWNAEPLAIGRRDERQLRPASRAQSLVADRLATGGAEVGQSNINDQAERRAQRRAQAGETASSGFDRRRFPVHCGTVSFLCTSLNVLSSGARARRSATPRSRARVHNHALPDRVGLSPAGGAVMAFRADVIQAGDRRLHAQTTILGKPGPFRK